MIYSIYFLGIFRRVKVTYLLTKLVLHPRSTYYHENLFYFLLTTSSVGRVGKFGSHQFTFSLLPGHQQDSRKVKETEM